MQMLLKILILNQNVFNNNKVYNFNHLRYAIFLAILVIGILVHQEHVDGKMFKN